MENIKLYDTISAATGDTEVKVETGEYYEGGYFTKTVEGVGYQDLQPGRGVNDPNPEEQYTIHFDIAYFDPNKQLWSGDYVMTYEGPGLYCIYGLGDSAASWYGKYTKIGEMQDGGDTYEIYQNASGMVVYVLFFDENVVAGRKVVSYVMINTGTTENPAYVDAYSRVIEGGMLVWINDIKSVDLCVTDPIPFVGYIEEDERVLYNPVATIAPKFEVTTDCDEEELFDGCTYSWDEVGMTQQLFEQICAQIASETTPPEWSNVWVNGVCMTEGLEIGTTKMDDDTTRLTWCNIWRENEFRIVIGLDENWDGFVTVYKLGQEILY